jgi:hypothetical protein
MPDSNLTDTTTPNTNTQDPAQTAVEVALASQPRAIRYRIIRAAHPDWTFRRCAKAAGYAKTTKREHIEAVVEGQAAAKAIDQQRTLLQMTPDTSMMAIAARLAAIASATVGRGKNASYANEARDRIRADHELAAMLDYKPENKLHIESRSLILELAGLTVEELRAIAGSPITPTQEL